MINGGAISAKDLQLLLNESYEKREQDVGDYEIDKDLSNLTTKVFKKKGTDEVFIVHRGSYDRKDWIANFNYLRRGYYNDDRLKQARKIQKATEDKYGANNVSTLGHSKGSKVAEEVGGNSKEIITLNKPTHITDIFRKVPKNQTDIKTSGDPVSLLRPLQRGNKPVILESDTSNPITEHKLGVLDDVDDVYGKGVSFSREEEAERRNRLTLEINALMNRYRQLNYIGLLQSWERSGRLPQQFRETRIRINQLATAFTDHILQIQILYSGRLTRQKYIDLEMHLDSANEVLRRLEEAVNSIVIPAYAQLAEPTPLAVATPIDDEDETEAVEATPIQTRGYGLFRKKIYNR